MHIYTHNRFCVILHISNSHHTGVIPLGYRYQAKSCSELTHQIPIEGFEYAEKDYRMILRELEFFLNPSKHHNPPYIFAKVGGQTLTHTVALHT